MSRRPVRFADLGSWSYQRAWDFQESIFTEVVERKSSNRKLPEEACIATHDTLLFVEHPHVYTLGKSGDFGNLLADDERLKSIGAEFYRTNRGGDITYHGPGQLVGYPILDLDEHFTDAVWLNPEPEIAWQGTIQDIGEVLPMFPLTVDGLTEGMALLNRGVRR